MPEPDVCTIDEFGPLGIVNPESVAELGDAVRQANAKGSAVYPVGGRTMLNLGLPPTKPGIAIDLRGLDQVLDFPARDMTITVQAGITMRRLQEITASKNLRLPIDVPFPVQATLGGAIATNMSGPRRYGFGTFRDYVIGISVINDEGQETKAGGRVVKNVAGYDLCKLHIGALGTLGMISQVTLKLKPLPERQSVVSLRIERDLTIVLDRLHRTRTRPVAITVACPAAAGAILANDERSEARSKATWQVLVGFEGNAEAVEWQENQLQREVEETGVHVASQWTDAESAHAWKALTDFPLAEPASVTFKANLLPSGTAALFEYLASSRDPIRFLAHAGSGIVIGHLDPAMSLADAQEKLRRILDIATAYQGDVTLLRCPPAWKKDLPVWGSPRSDNWLMKAVKDKLDPRGLFNPGRFVAGI
jgi:glycolate oxidase FAD binding subunit